MLRDWRITAPSWVAILVLSGACFDEPPQVETGATATAGASSGSSGSPSAVSASSPATSDSDASDGATAVSSTTGPGETTTTSPPDTDTDTGTGPGMPRLPLDLYDIVCLGDWTGLGPPQSPDEPVDLGCMGAPGEQGGIERRETMTIAGVDYSRVFVAYPRDGPGGRVLGTIALGPAVAAAVNPILQLRIECVLKGAGGCHVTLNLRIVRPDNTGASITQIGVNGSEGRMFTLPAIFGPLDRLEFSLDNPVDEGFEGLAFHSVFIVDGP